MAVEHQRYRPIIHEFDIHMSLKLPCFHLYSRGARRGDKFFVVIASLFGTGGGDERRATPFAAVSEQRELADHEQRSSDFRKLEVHFPFGIFEDPQAERLARDRAP